MAEDSSPPNIVGSTPRWQVCVNSLKNLMSFNLKINFELVEAILLKNSIWSLLFRNIWPVRLYVQAMRIHEHSQSVVQQEIH